MSEEFKLFRQEEIDALRAELANAHDRTKCPNCENCLTNLRQDVERLEAELARKDAELDSANAEITRLEEALLEWENVYGHRR